MDRLVDEWSLRQIAQGNTDTRFLNADRDQRIEMMSNGMFDETDDERLIRHPSEELVIYIAENDDDTSTWTPLIGARANTNGEESSSSSAASAPRARLPLSNWVSKWVHTDHNAPNVTGRLKRARARAKAKTKAKTGGRNASSTSAEVAAASSAASAEEASNAEAASQRILKIPYLFVDNERLEEFLMEERYEGGREFIRTQHGEARIKGHDHGHIPTIAANAGEAPSHDDGLPPSSSNGGQNLNSNNPVTSPLDRGVSTQSQQIFTPLQEAVATPPIILSVAETGIDYTEVLEELVTKGIKYTKLEAVFNESL